MTEEEKDARYARVQKLFQNALVEALAPVEDMQRDPIVEDIIRVALGTSSMLVLGQIMLEANSWHHKDVVLLHSNGVAGLIDAGYAGILAEITRRLHIIREEQTSSVRSRAERN